MSFRTEEDVKEKLDGAAKAKLHQWQLSEIDAGIADSDSGKGYTTGELRTRLRKGGVEIKK